jgi:hypothetical protein
MMTSGREYARKYNRRLAKREVRVPREFTEGPEDWRNSEREEIEEHREADEAERLAREIVREAAEEAERLEHEEQLLKEVISESEEIEAAEEEAREILEETIRELKELEEDLGYKVDRAREELHDEFVNDMENKLDCPSLKELQSDSHEFGECEDRDETPSSGETYIDGGDGTVYVMETGGSSPAEVSPDCEIEEHTQAETNEDDESREERHEENEVNASSEVRNSIIKTDSAEETEGEEIEASAPEKRETLQSVETGDGHCPTESDVEAPKKETREQESVIEHEDAERAVEDEQEEAAEVRETENLHEFHEGKEKFNEQELDEIHEEGVVSKSLDEELEVTDDFGELVDADTKIEISDDAQDVNEPEVSARSETPFEAEVCELPDDVPDDLLRKIEELLDELESLADEEMDESRVIAEAMTGRRHIDRSLEPQPYFSETPEGLERKERERVREKAAALFTKLTEIERKRFKEFVRARLKSEDDLDAWLRVHSSLQSSPDFKQHYADAKRYLRGRKLGGVPRLIRELWKAEVERVWIQLIATVVQRRALALPVSRTAAKEIAKEWMQERLDELLLKHKHLTKYAKFKVRYRNAVSWIVLIQRLRSDEVQAEPPIDVLKSLSKEFMISVATIRKWLKLESKPMLIVQLERLSGARAKPGGWQQPLADSGLRPNEIRIGEAEQLTSNEAPLKTQTLELINKIISMSKYSIWFVEFPSDFIAILEYIKSNREELERVLSSNEIRISLSIYSDRLFIFRRRIDQFSWTEMLEDELFYLDSDWKRETLGHVLGKMRLRNLKELSHVVRELTGHIKDSVPVGGLNADLQSGRKYLTGRTLGFVLSAMNFGIRQAKSRITAIGKSKGGTWQIRNPRFPEGLELQMILARLYAIIASDGHIERGTYGVSYFEKNSERKERIRSILASLGDVWINEYLDPERADSLSFPPTVGRLMHKLGIPLGDKVLQSFGIPSFIINGAPEIQSAYLQELIPEEGAVTYDVYGGLKILWGRSVVLHEQRVEKDYAGQKHLASNLMEFIKNHGKYERKRNCYRLSAGRLRSLKRSENTAVAQMADELERIARSSKNKLQQDEQQLCKNLGIKTGCHLCYLRYYVRSGRVSAHWEAHTSSQKDVEAWWKTAPPNDKRKWGRLHDFFTREVKDEEEPQDETPK